jgi:hypothetical protein
VPLWRAATQPFRFPDQLGIDFGPPQRKLIAEAQGGRRYVITAIATALNERRRQNPGPLKNNAIAENHLYSMRYGQKRNQPAKPP